MGVNEQVSDKFLQSKLFRREWVSGCNGERQTERSKEKRKADVGGRNG